MTNIFVGTQDISAGQRNIYVGQSPVWGIYLGQTLIWRKLLSYSGSQGQYENPIDMQWRTIHSWTVEGWGHSTITVSHSWTNSLLMWGLSRREIRILVNGNEVGIAYQEHTTEVWSSTLTASGVALAHGNVIEIQTKANATYAACRRVTINSASHTVDQRA